MSQIREIKDRMNGIQSTMKITKAMYMISSTKIYSLRKQILTILQNLPDHFEHPYLDSREYIDEKHQNKAIICVTGDKGLAGAYNLNVLKLTEQIIKAHPNYKLYMIGEVGRQYFLRRHIPVEESFLYTAQNPTLSRARSISSKMLELYAEKTIDEVLIIYTRMDQHNQFTVDVEQLLPLYRLNQEVEVGGQTIHSIQLEPSSFGTSCNLCYFLCDFCLSLTIVL